MMMFRIVFDGLCQFVAAHFRHHDVGHDQIECLLLDDIQCFPAILGDIDAIILPKQLPHEYQ